MQAAEAAAKNQRLGIAQARQDAAREAKVNAAAAAKEERELAKAAAEALAARTFKGYIRGHKGKEDINRLYDMVRRVLFIFSHVLCLSII